MCAAPGAGVGPRRCTSPPGRVGLPALSTTGRRPAPPPGDVAGRADPGGLLSEKERGALGLVLIGGLDYVRASRVLGICPRDLAALLRTALLRLATSSAAVAEDSSQGKWA